MRNTNILCILAAAALLCALPATAADPAATDAPTTAAVAPDIQRYVGKWEGPWRLAMNGGRVALVINADPKEPGTIAVTNLAAFGDQPVAIERVKAGPSSLAFRAAGADNRRMTVTLDLGKDDKLEGHLLYDDFTNRCQLHRVP